MSKRKDTYMTGPAQPRQPMPGNIEAARWVASAARRYADGRATLAEVRDAFRELETEHARTANAGG